MAPTGIRPAVLLAVAALLALIALFLPWWSVNSTMSGGAFGTVKGTDDAAPFDDRVDGAVLTGVFWVVALLAVVATVVLVLAPMGTPPWVPVATASAGALLLILLPLLAIVTWPGSGASFWGTETARNAASSVTSSRYANVGWYIALVSGLVCAGGALLAWRSGRAPMVQAVRAVPSAALPSKPTPKEPVAPLAAVKVASRKVSTAKPVAKSVAANTRRSK